MRSIYLLEVICFFVLHGCGNKNAEEKKFFDVPGYFKQEIEYIKTNFSTFSKTSVYNGHTSMQELNVKDVNWEKEFALFFKSDINKPLYQANMYRMDWPAIQPEKGGEGKGGYSILPVNKTLDIQSVDIQTGKNFFIKISIQKLNLLSETKIIASYYKDSIYSILGEQHIKGISTNSFSVVGKFK